MPHQTFFISQNLVIRNGLNKALILRHKTGPWLLPGGKINTGETWKEALSREIKEETGIDFSSVHIERIVDCDSWIENDAGYYVITLLASTPNELQVSLSEEHSGYAWVSTSELDTYNFWTEKIKARIKKALTG